jgi:hypothetical protein
MSTSIKRWVLLTAIVLASLTVACGGGRTVVGGPPPPTGNFSNANLKGQYAFLMSGTEICSGLSSFFTRAGSFTADGSGHITGGLEDVNVCTGVFTLQFTNSTYSITADGRGTLSLTNTTGTTNYSITLSSATGGVIAQTDVNLTASGSFQRQNVAAFSDLAITGGYVFDFNGISATANPESFIGRFDAEGGGHIASTSGLFDSNEAGTLSGQQFFPAGAFYKLDANGDGTNFGRGTANIAGHNFDFYIVDATRLKLLGADPAEAFSGEAFAQQNISFTAASLNSGFAFLIGGSGMNGPVATAGRFNADGAGNLTSIFLDENNSGTITQLPSGTVTGSYSVDANQLGGGTLTWTDSKVPGSFSFIFYLISPTQAVFQETDNNITSDGTLLAQTAGPVSPATLAGEFAFVWSGVSSGGEEDFVGQLKLTSASGNNATGIMDFNQFSVASPNQLFNLQFNGPLTITPPGTGPNTLVATTTTSSLTPFTFTVYAVDANNVFLVGVDTARVLAGSVVRQP